MQGGKRGKGGHVAHLRAIEVELAQRRKRNEGSYVTHARIGEIEGLQS